MFGLSSFSRIILQKQFFRNISLNGFETVDLSLINPYNETLFSLIDRSFCQISSIQTSLISLYIRMCFHCNLFLD